MQALFLSATCLAQRYGLACVAVFTLLAGAASEYATAGVNAWTSTGPRTEWIRLAADPRPDGAILVAGNHAYRSTDQGENWSLSSLSDAQALTFDPSVPHRIYAAFGSYRLFRSDDDGANWAPLA